MALKDTPSLIMYSLLIVLSLILQPYAITNMHVGEIGGEEVLVTTDDSGHVVIRFTANNFSRPPLNLKLPMSAWGIHTHSSDRLLAVSCNAHIVTLFHLGMGIDGWIWTTATPDLGENIAKLVLRGHTNNIPCVAFERTGKYVVSGSLDCSVRLWDCKTGTCVKMVITPNRHLCLPTFWGLTAGFGRFVSSTDLISNTSIVMKKVRLLVARSDQ